MRAAPQEQSDDVPRDSASPSARVDADGRADLVTPDAIAIAEGLLADDSFQSARRIDPLVPDASGIYAIAVTDVRALPAPFDTLATERGHSLIYIGKAQNLRSRFLEEELRGRRNGMFFRSLGALLGYRPLQGSLFERKNQRNYRFTHEDTASIGKWINANLVVSFVGVEQVLKPLEVELIKGRLPLLNLDDNSVKLPELEALRRACRVIASTPQTALSAS